MYKNYVVLLFLAFLLFGCVTAPEKDVQNIEHDKTIIEDAKSKHPSADIIEIESVDLMDGINVTSVRVSYYTDSICPERYRLRYRFPDFGYETGVPIEVVKNCEYKYTPDSIITYEEQAIVAAHTLQGTSEVKEFIGNGDDITVKTNFYSTTDVWEVLFYNTISDETMRVTIQAKNPKIIVIKKLVEE